MIEESNTVYVLKFEPTDGDWIYGSLQNGEGRFGWGYVETADLRSLRERVRADGYHSLHDDEKGCCMWFLLDIKPGDYVVCLNVPTRGECSVARVSGEYFFAWDSVRQDFGHRFHVDPSTLRTFRRNDDDLVHPLLQSRLALRGRWWRLYARDEFAVLLRALQSGTPSTVVSTTIGNLAFLARDIRPALQKITQVIRDNFPRKRLEWLMEEVFRKLPNVTRVERKDGAADKGADLLVYTKTGIPVGDLDKEEQLCLVQCKCYAEQHWNLRGIEDLRAAFQEYQNANMALLVSTADASSEDLDNAIEGLANEVGRPVGLLIGPELASFVLKYAGDVVLQGYEE